MPFLFLKTLGEELSKLTTESCLCSKVFENTSILIKGLLFKWLQSEKEFESLPKSFFHKTIQFKNKQEQEELQKLHHEIQKLLPKEKEIILGYLCRENFSFSFIDITKSLSQNSFAQNMPYEYLENCLSRIAVALESKAKLYKELLEPLAVFFQACLKKEEALQYPENDNDTQKILLIRRHPDGSKKVKAYLAVSESSDDETPSPANCCCPFF